jgi:hypothetical protein
MLVLTFHADTLACVRLRLVLLIASFLARNEDPTSSGNILDSAHGLRIGRSTQLAVGISGKQDCLVQVTETAFGKADLATTLVLLDLPFSATLSCWCVSRAVSREPHERRILLLRCFLASLLLDGEGREKLGVLAGELDEADWITLTSSVSRLSPAYGWRFPGR